MNRLITRLLSLLRNPRTRAMIEQARRQAADPRNRQRMAQIRNRWARRR